MESTIIRMIVMFKKIVKDLGNRKREVKQVNSRNRSRKRKM